jgi:hypothetical protein
VRTRLRSLERRGFPRSTEARPNPSLFGVLLSVAEMPVPDGAQVDRLRKEAGLVGRVTFVRDILHEADRKLRVHFVSDTAGAMARRAAILRRLSRSDELRGPEAYRIPPCEREPGLLDWRILRALRKRPDGSLAEVAADTHGSLKTVTRRFRALRWAHGADCEEMPLGLVRLPGPDGAHRAETMDRLAKEIPEWMPVGRRWHRGPPPIARRTSLRD